MRYPSGKTHLHEILVDPVAHARTMEFLQIPNSRKGARHLPDPAAPARRGLGGDRAAAGADREALGGSSLRSRTRRAWPTLAPSSARCPRRRCGEHGADRGGRPARERDVRRPRPARRHEGRRHRGRGQEGAAGRRPRRGARHSPSSCRRRASPGSPSRSGPRRAPSHWLGTQVAPSSTARRPLGRPILRATGSPSMPRRSG